MKSLCLNLHRSQLAPDSGAEDREEVQRLSLWSISKYLLLQMDCHLPEQFQLLYNRTDLLPVTLNPKSPFLKAFITAMPGYHVKSQQSPGLSASPAGSNGSFPLYLNTKSSPPPPPLPVPSSISRPPCYIFQKKKKIIIIK